MRKTFINSVISVEMDDGSVWEVPVMVVARNRAKHYADEFDGDIGKSLEEDTIPFFASDSYEIIDWAENNMNWEDVEQFATMVQGTDAIDYQDSWVNGPKEVLEK